MIMKSALRYMACASVMIVIFQLIFFLCIEKNYWFHPEGIGAFVTVDQAPFLNIKDSVLHGDYMDANAGRFRPVSHFIEFIDSKLRMSLAYWVGPNPILNTFSCVLTLLLTWWLLFRIFRKWLQDPWLIVALMLLMICSTAYLSNFIFLFRPAKRTVILCSIYLLLILTEFLEKPSWKKLSAAYAGMLGLLLSDEEGIFIAGIFGLLFLVPLVIKKHLKQNMSMIGAWCVANALGFSFIVIKILFAAESSFAGSVHDITLIEAAGEFFNAELISMILLLAQTLYTGAFGPYQPLWVNLGLVLFLGASGVFVYYKREVLASDSKEYMRCIILLSVSLFSFVYFPLFSALLQQMGGGIFMRAAAYYYGSSLFIGQLFILTALLSILSLCSRISLPNMLNSCVIFAVAFLASSNLTTFNKMNQLVETMHYAPRYAFDLNQILDQHWHDRNICVKSHDLPRLAIVNRNDEIARHANDVFGSVVGHKCYSSLKMLQPLDEKVSATPLITIESLITHMNFCKQL